MNKINLQSLAWLEIFVLTAALVAGTGLGGAWEFAVAYDAGLRVVLSQLLQ